MKYIIIIYYKILIFYYEEIENSILYICYICILLY